MTINPQNISDPASSESSEALRQIANLLKQIAPLNLHFSPNSQLFKLEGNKDIDKGGIISAHGKIVDDQTILVQIKLVEAPAGALMKAGSLFKHLASLGEKVQIVPPQEESSGLSSLWVELKIKAEPMSMSRSNAFLSELNKIDLLGRNLQAELPQPPKNESIEKVYADFKEYLEPVYPLHDVTNVDEGLFHWAQQTANFLSASYSVAIEAPSQSISDFCLSLLASVSRSRDEAIGKIKTPEINSKGLLELTHKAPGRIAASAIQLGQGTNRYERRSEMPLLLVSLLKANRPMIFTGKQEELQAVFHGGQGGINDPLIPVVLHAPEIDLERLVKFSIHGAGRKIGRLSTSDEDRFAQAIYAAIKSSADPHKHIIATTNFLIDAWRCGRKKTKDDLSTFISLLENQTETLAGLRTTIKTSRSISVQNKFARVLSEPGLISYFKKHLVAQDHALEKFDTCLKSQLSRPKHQPFCACLVGTPGTGKSESAALLAKRLNVPLVNIDAAGYADSYTARAELKGSGRGLVGSDESGRLEKVAKHHTGAVLEISDLDHAAHQARLAFADQFLKVLEKGEAETATGITFPCANIIFLFTMNLPQGMDEKLRKGLGFTGSKSRGEIEKDYEKYLKQLFSGAFLRRIGAPIIFEPLNGNALVLIIERAIEDAIHNMAENFNLNIQQIIFQKNTGLKVMSSVNADLLSYGASALLEKGRSLATDAVLKLMHQNSPSAFNKLIISANDDGNIMIHPK